MTYTQRAPGVAPRRIQRKRLKGWRMPPGAVYVGRPTRWGNPFVIGEPVTISGWQADGDLFDLTVPLTREQAVLLYRDNLLGSLTLYSEDMHPDDIAYVVENRRRIDEELRGRDLGCWCVHGAPCHADVLLEIANGAWPLP